MDVDLLNHVKNNFVNFFIYLFIYFNYIIGY